MSDPHRGRRSVLALTFASGRKLVYKPKDMGTEAAYHRLLAWLNERGAPLPFKVLQRTRPLHARLGGVRGASAVPGSGRGQALLRAGGHAALPVLRARGHGLSLREHHRERRVPRAHRHGDADAPPRPCSGPRARKRADGGLRTAGPLRVAHRAVAPLGVERRRADGIPHKRAGRSGRAGVAGSRAAVGTGKHRPDGPGVRLARGFEQGRTYPGSTAPR